MVSEERHKCWPDQSILKEKIHERVSMLICRYICSIYKCVTKEEKAYILGETL